MFNLLTCSPALHLHSDCPTSSIYNSSNDVITKGHYDTVGILYLNNQHTIIYWFVCSDESITHLYTWHRSHDMAHISRPRRPRHRRRRKRTSRGDSGRRTCSRTVTHPPHTPYTHCCCCTRHTAQGTIHTMLPPPPPCQRWGWWWGHTPYKRIQVSNE